MRTAETLAIYTVVISEVQPAGPHEDVNMCQDTEQMGEPA